MLRRGERINCRQKSANSSKDLQCCWIYLSVQEPLNEQKLKYKGKVSGCRGIEWGKKWKSEERKWFRKGEAKDRRKRRK